jgi:LacI family transcriptional regulator
VVNRFPTVERTTISDVAARAGVSKGTVSKYLSPTDYYMSVKTQDRVEAAIRDLNFTPNTLAQSLTTRRTMTIGVVVASIANPFYPELVAGVEDVIEPEGYTLLLGSASDTPERENRVVRSMIQRRVDGVIVASARMRDRAVQDLVAEGVHVVVASREMTKLIADTVVVDNQFGGRMAGLHLRDVHGFNEVAFLGTEEVLAFRHRLSGLRSVFADKVSVWDANSTTLADATVAALDMLTAVRRPSAVFAGSDSLAAGVLAAAGQLALSVPGDLAVIGFDDIWVSALPGVALTSVGSRTREVGQMAAHMLADKIAAGTGGGGHNPRRRRVLLKPNFVARRSCGC